MLPLYTQTVDLERAVEHDGAPLTSVTLREITIGDHLDMKALGLAADLSEVWMIGRLSGLPEQVIRSLRVSDYKRCQDALVRIFAQANGEPAPAALTPGKKAPRRKAKG